MASILDQKLKDVESKLTTIDSESTQALLQNLLQQVKSKHTPIDENPVTNIQGTVNSMMEKVDIPEPEGTDPFSNLGQLFSTMMKDNSFLGSINKLTGTMQKFAIKKEDILAWRSNPEMLQLLKLDPRARYMYLSPTPLLPSLSGLYLELKIEPNPIYVLFTSHHEVPLIYSENILTQDFIQRIYEEESVKFDPMIRNMMVSQISQISDIDRYWNHLDANLDPRPKPRPVYIEDDL